MQGSQFLPLEAFAVVIVPFGLAVPVLWEGPECHSGYPVALEVPR